MVETSVIDMATMTMKEAEIASEMDSEVQVTATELQPLLNGRM